MISKKLVGILIAFFCLTAILRAQEVKKPVTFEASISKSNLGLNERLRVDFTMNRDGDNFTAPDFEGFRIVMGPSQSISSSWVKGVRSYSKTYSYVLVPTERGNFTIKQASIVIDGETYKSLAKKATVTAAVDNPNGEKDAGDVADENLHLVAEVSKTNPFLNEAVTVVYKLYVSNKINVNNFKPLDNPKYNNFWSQDIPVNKFDVKNSTYQGEPYRSVVLKRIVLYPQKAGKLEIEPLSLDVSLQVPTNRRNFFGERVFAKTNKTVAAGRRIINVKDLPSQGKPVGFSGAVGDFDFSLTTSKKSLNASESLQAKITVSGKGNLKLLSLPELNLPNSLEVYEPEFEENVRTTLSGMQGKVSNSYTVVPSFKGKYPIKPISFSFFNPKTEKYTTLLSEEIGIDVIQGPNDTAANGNTSTTPNQQQVVAIGDQFSFIKLTPNLSSIGTNYFFKSTPFYLWLFLPLLCIPLAILFSRKRDAIASDVVGNKSRKASRLARKYLSAAKKTLGNKEAFYVVLEKALHNYLKAKLKIETSEFSKHKITNLLAQKEVDTTTTDRFVELLENCEAARYSQFSQVQMQDDYDKASEVISYLDKQL